MRCFFLRRHKDPSGVSGIGVVAEGVVFETGKVALSWLSEHSTVTLLESVEDVLILHGHEGDTELIWDDEEEKT